MKNYRLSNSYKEFIERFGNQYNDDYIERIDPNDEIKPIMGYSIDWRRVSFMIIIF